MLCSSFSSQRPRNEFILAVIILPWNQAAKLTRTCVCLRAHPLLTSAFSLTLVRSTSIVLASSKPSNNLSAHLTLSFALQTQHNCTAKELNVTSKEIKAFVSHERAGDQQLSSGAATAGNVRSPSAGHHSVGMLMKRHMVLLGGFYVSLPSDTLKIDSRQDVDMIRAQDTATHWQMGEKRGRRSFRAAPLTSPRYRKVVGMGWASGSKHAVLSQR